MSFSPMFRFLLVISLSFLSCFSPSWSFFPMLPFPLKFLSILHGLIPLPSSPCVPGPPSSCPLITHRHSSLSFLSFPLFFRPFMPLLSLLPLFLSFLILVFLKCSTYLFLSVSSQPFPCHSPFYLPILLTIFSLHMNSASPFSPINPLTLFPSRWQPTNGTSAHRDVTCD